MPPIPINRRRFLGASAAAGWAISQGRVEGAANCPSSGPVRVGVVGLGSRGTTLIRTLLELAEVEVIAVADLEPKHQLRAAGIVEKARGRRPEVLDRVEALVARTDVDAVVAALPCDLHAQVYADAIRAGKHLYGEKPLALTLADCDLVARAAEAAPHLAVHIGYQRRSNPRYRAAIGLVHRGEIGPLISASASWISSNGPMNGHDGWLASRARSGDWMVEQAVHIWDVLTWLTKGQPPLRAFGHGRRDLFADLQPGRDVTDDYAVQLDWADGFRVAFAQSWAAPADAAFTGIEQKVLGRTGGIDLATGSVTFRDRARPRQSLHPTPQPDTKLALQAFIDAVRTHPEARQPVPITLAEATTATAVGLLVRQAVDERRVVAWDEVRSAEA